MLLFSTSKSITYFFLIVNRFFKKIIKKFDCVKQCVNEYPELSASQINRVLNKTIKSHKGYTFKYQDDDIV